MDRDERKILGRCASSIKNCKLLVKGDAGELERLSLRPPRIAWVSQWQGRSSQGPEAVDANSVSENESLYDVLPSYTYSFHFFYLSLTNLFFKLTDR
jgi:hypothetical protein